MKKPERKSKDIVSENIQKLKELFPEAFTEGKVDFEVLKELLGTYAETENERYRFTWNGKSKARMIAQTPSTGTLRPCKEESVDWDTTRNLFLEGDNLEVLKLLQKRYYKKVKMIYIDPPYNTGKDFVYKDNFKDSIKHYKEITGQVDGEGRNLSNNPETSGRYHTDWLNMMYPRLKLARNLLKEDGVIFISIDDNEVSNLRKICDEVFGEENFIANVIWQRAFSPKNDVKYLSENHDYVLIYCKSVESFESGRLPRSEEANARYKNLDNDPRGIWISDNLTVKTYSEKYDYPITTPSDRVVNPAHGSCWRVSKERFQELVDDNRIWFGTDGGNVPRLKRFLSEVQDGMVATTLWMHQEVGHNQEGRQEVKTLFDDKGYFDGPKPVRLLDRILQIANTGEEDIIFDFFAGSSTTAHAVMHLNSLDNGNRKFIMVQLPEPCDKDSEACKAGYKTIAEISKERIRRAGKKIKEDNPDYNGDLGFKVFKLDSTNIKPWEADFDLDEKQMEAFVENIKTDRREEDVLYEILIKYGLDLALPVTEHVIDGQKIFTVGGGTLTVCLSDDLSLKTVEGIAKLKEELNPETMRVVFKDTGFRDDVLKTNAIQILKTAGVVDVRSL